MFGINDYKTVRFLAEDHHHSYRPLARRSLRRSARRAAADGARQRS